MASAVGSSTLNMPGRMGRARGPGKDDEQAASEHSTAPRGRRNRRAAPRRQQHRMAFRRVTMAEIKTSPGRSAEICSLHRSQPSAPRSRPARRVAASFDQSLSAANLDSHDLSVTIGAEGDAISSICSNPL
jgi:hypothetical protein